MPHNPFHDGVYTPGPSTTDKLESTEYIKIVDVLCEGEIEGLVDGAKSIYLNGTAVQSRDPIVTGWITLPGDFNFSLVKAEPRVGEQGQAHLPGFTTVENEVSVNIEVTRDGTPTPDVPTAVGVTQTISNSPSPPDRIRVSINIPRLTEQNENTGKLGGSTVEYKIWLRDTNSPTYAGFREQNIGTTLQPIEVLGTTTATTSAIAHGFDGVVSWQKPNLPLDDDDDDWAYEEVTVKWRVKYRPSGGAWVTIDDYELTDRANGRLVTNRGRFAVNRLPVGVYEILVTPLNSWGDNGEVRLAYVTEWTLDGSAITRGKATSLYSKTHMIDLTQPDMDNGPWELRVARITEDSVDDLVQNQTFWDTYTEIIDQKLSYPHTALIGLELSSEEFSGIPARAYDVKLLKIKIPSNYNPISRVYTGLWDGTFKVAWSDNPAWCFYDLLTNDRYGLGKFIDSSLVDSSALYTIGQYCDETVSEGVDRGTVDGVVEGVSGEPRFTCNMYLQTRQEAYTVLNNMASVFRGMLYWNNNQITAVQDSYAEVFSQFTNADVEDGLFNYEGSSARIKHNVVLVSWNDPENEYKQTIEYIEDAASVSANGIVETEIVAMGCTSRGQAHRVGKWLLYVEQYENEVVSFRTGLEGLQVLPGKIIKTSDQHRAGVRHGGRITASTDSTVTLDSDLVISNVPVLETYTITNVLQDGELHDSVIDEGAGTYPAGTALNLTTNFSDSASSWEATNATYDGSGSDISLASEDTNVTGIRLSTDGLKLFAVGTASEAVHRYSLSPAWDVSSAVYDGGGASLDVSNEDIDPQNIYFRTEGANLGRELYVLGLDTIRSYTLTTAWDLSTATYDLVAEDFVIAGETSARSLAFNDVGTLMYVASRSTAYIRKYILSPAWDIKSAVYQGATTGIWVRGKNSANNIDMYLRPDGTKMFIGTDSNSIYLLSGEDGLWLGDPVAETMVGSELVTDGDMSSNVNWVEGTGWGIAAGVATKTAGTASVLSQTGILTTSENNIITLDITVSAGGLTVNLGSTGLGKLITSTGTHTFTGVVAGSTDLRLSTNSAFAGTVDNVSVRLADKNISPEYRATHTNGLGVYGSVTKAAVAAGAELMGYSGFSVSNYLQQPYNSVLDFGTGDFCVAGWFKNSDTGSNKMMLDRSDTSYTGSRLDILKTSADAIRFLVTDSAGNTVTTTSDALPTMIDGSWNFITCLKRGTASEIYFNGDLIQTGVLTSIVNMDNTSAILRVGLDAAGNNPFDNGDLSLFRIFDYAPSAAQVSEIYQSEKVLVVANAPYNNFNIYQYTLPTPWEIGTALYDGDGSSFTISSEGTFPNTLNFDAEGLKMYMGDADSVYTYSIDSTATPADYSVWVASSNVISPEEWRVISITEESTGIYSVSALKYNKTKHEYVDTGNDLEIPQVSLISTDQPDITGLVAEESLYLLTPYTAAARLEISWNPPERAVRYEVRYRFVNDNTEIVQTYQPRTEILNTIPGSYYIEVVAFNSIGRQSNVVSITKIVVGLTAPPSDVTNFNINSIGETSYLSWNGVTDLDLDHYEVRYNSELSGVTWSQSSILVEQISRNTSSIVVPSLIGTYLIKAFDQSGYESVNEALITSNIYGLDGLNVVEVVTEDPTFGGNLGDGFALDLSVEAIDPQSIKFNNDGTKIYALSANNITRYAVASPYVTASATWEGLSTSKDISAEATDMRSIYFKPDGLKFYALSENNSYIYEYDMSPAWDVAAATLNDSKWLGIASTTMTGLTFRPSGLEIFVTNNTTDSVHTFPLSTAWDITTVVLAGEDTMDTWGTLDNLDVPPYLLSSEVDVVSGETVTPQDIVFNDTGTKMYILAAEGVDRVMEYTLSTTWNILTTTYGGVTFTVDDRLTAPTGLMFNPTGSSLSVVGTDTDFAYSATVSTPYDVSTALWDENLIVESGQLKLRDPLASLTGTYTFLNSIDLLGVVTSRITPTIRVFSDNVSNVMSGWVTLTGVASLSGLIVADAYTIELQLRYTSDNPNVSPTWTAWDRFIIGDYTARAFEFRVILTSTDPLTTPVVDLLRITIDMPDRVYGELDLLTTTTLGEFVSVSSDGTNRVMTSPDGSTWSPQSASSASTWAGVVYSPEESIFCAVASAGTDTVMTSSDGVTWTPRTVSTPANGWQDVTWSPALSLFCAVATSGTANRVMTSPNGIVWTDRAAISNSWESVTWSPSLGVFCAVSSTGGTDRTMTSSDGTSWTGGNIVANSWEDVAWSPDLQVFCAVASSGTTTTRVASSYDGLNWVYQTVPTSRDWSSVTWSSELQLFCIVSSNQLSNGVATSPDGVTWTNRTGATTDQWTEVIWSPELALFCVVASTGTSTGAMTSVDGINWTTRAPSEDNSWQHLTWRPSGLQITYDPPFLAEPSLAISAQGLTVGDYYVITGKTRFGFSIIFKDSGQIARARTFDYVAKGYGYVT